MKVTLTTLRPTPPHSRQTQEEGKGNLGSSRLSPVYLFNNCILDLTWQSYLHKIHESDSYCICSAADGAQKVRVCAGEAGGES